MLFTFFIVVDSSSNNTWLKNPSFEPFTEPIEVDVIPSTSSEPTKLNLTSEEKQIHKKSKNKDKKKHKHKKHNRSVSPEPIVFTGNEEYYVDKKSERGFLSVKTLHRPACPRYEMS